MKTLVKISQTTTTTKKSIAKATPIKNQEKNNRRNKAQKERKTRIGGEEYLDRKLIDFGEKRLKK